MLRRGAQGPGHQGQGPHRCRWCAQTGSGRHQGTQSYGRQVGIDFSATGRRTKRSSRSRAWPWPMAGRPFLPASIWCSRLVHGWADRAQRLGKSTLLHLLAGEEQPLGRDRDPGTESGRCHFRPEARTARQGSDPAPCLHPDSDSVIYRGQPCMWSPGPSASPCARNSSICPWGCSPAGAGPGAYRPAHAARCRRVLLDEPTNDLDIPTLEMLEKSARFPGAVVLVPDRSCSIGCPPRSWGWTAGGPRSMRLCPVGGGFLDRERPAPGSQGPGTQTGPGTRRDVQKKLTFKEQREWGRDGGRHRGGRGEPCRCQIALEDPAVASDGAELARRLAASQGPRPSWNPLCPLGRARSQTRSCP